MKSVVCKIFLDPS